MVTTPVTLPVTTRVTRPVTIESIRIRIRIRILKDLRRRRTQGAKVGRSLPPFHPAANAETCPAGPPVHMTPSVAARGPGSPAPLPTPRHEDLGTGTGGAAGRICAGAE